MNTVGNIDNETRTTHVISVQPTIFIVGLLFRDFASKLIKFH